MNRGKIKYVAQDKLMLCSRAANKALGDARPFIEKQKITG